MVIVRSGFEAITANIPIHATQMKTSVLIANYNNGPLLERAIISAWEADEIVVYDDGSTDGSGARAAQRWQGCEKLKVILGPRPPFAPATNQCNAYVQAFRQSTGDVIFLLDGDDEFNPGKVARCVGLIRSGEVFIQHLQSLADGQPFRPNRPYPEHLHSFVRRTHCLGWWGGETSALVMTRPVFLAAMEGLSSTEYPHLWADARICLSLLGGVHSGEGFLFTSEVMGRYHFDPNKPTKTRQYIRRSEDERLAYFRAEVNADFSVSRVAYLWRRLLDWQLLKCLIRKVKI